MKLGPYLRGLCKICVNEVFLNPCCCFYICFLLITLVTGLWFSGEASGLDLCISVLELLQWKADIQDEAELLVPLTNVLQQLLSSVTQAAATASAPASSAMDASDDESPSDEDADAEQQPQPRCGVCLAHHPPFVCGAVHVQNSLEEQILPVCRHHNLLVCNQLQCL